MSRHRSRPVVIAVRQITLDGQLVPYVVKRSSVARQVRFEIKPGTGLAVILPRRCDAGDVDQMLESKKRWILRAMEKFAGACRADGDGTLRFGDVVPYLGQDLRIVNGSGVWCSRGVELEGQTLVVRGDPDGSSLRSLLERWYRAQAAIILESKVRGLGAGHARFSIRGQRTRWASCSHRGTLSFNWRLIMAPEAVVDYVVIHEVAHLREMNHTTRFWQLVADRCPMWRQHKRWLDDHGAELAAVLGAP